VLVAVLAAGLLAGASGCGGDQESSSAGVVFGSAAGGTSGLARGVASAQGLIASVQRSVDRANATFEELRRCLAGSLRPVTRSDRCYAIAASLAGSLREAVRNADLATDLLFVTTVAGCAITNVLCPVKQVVRNAQNKIRDMAVATVNLVSGVPNLPGAAWEEIRRGVDGAWSNVKLVLTDAAAELGKNTAEKTEDLVAASTEVTVSIIQQIRDGVISAIDAIRQGLITCEEAKAAGVYPSRLPCP
jgi:hypothetical protein